MSSCQSFLQWLHVPCEWLFSARNPRLNGLGGVQGGSSVVTVRSAPTTTTGGPHAGCFVRNHTHPGFSLCLLPLAVCAELCALLSGEAVFLFAW